MRFRAMGLGLAAAAALTLGGCAAHLVATTYAEGASDAPYGGGVWQVSFFGNAYTSEETVQTYWLYRCAEVTLEKGYDGFRIVSSVTLTQRGPPPGSPMVIRIDTTSAAIAAYAQQNRPSMRGDIKLLKKPLTPEPGKTFDAAALKAFLDPHVNGEKCKADNVCPHVHRYLYPPGA